MVHFMSGTKGIAPRSVPFLGGVHVWDRHRDRVEFVTLLEGWRQERPRFSSSLAEIIACPSYLRIIAMGKRALPLIMEQLESEGSRPDHWCAALEAITGEDPVPEGSRGDTVRIAKAWLEWNRAQTDRFLDSTTRITELQAALTLDTTVLRGPRNALLHGGGLDLESERQHIGPREFRFSGPSKPLLQRSGQSATCPVVTDLWKRATRKSPSSHGMDFRNMPLDSSPTGSGRAN